MKKRKVCLFVHDLAMNPIVRAYPLAKAIQAAGFEVEVFGLLISGDEVYAPYRNAFPYTTVRIQGRACETWQASHWLASKAAHGDIMYGFKPRNTGFLPALIASGWGKTKPLLLDAEDNELFDRVSGLRNLYRGLLSHHPPVYFVFTSSIAVYGAGQLPMTEDPVPQPEDPYGIAKYAIEMDLRAAHEMFGLNYIVFRPTMCTDRTRISAISTAMSLGFS